MRISPISMSFIAIILFMTSCKVQKSAINEQKVFTEVKKVLFAQEESWNKGDIPAFMEGYWKDKGLTFVGKNGVTYGWDETLANYKKSYPDKETMGILSFDIIEMNLLSENTCHVIGKYTLKRKSDEPSGHFSLIWKKIDGQWLVTSDHTSG